MPLTLQGLETQPVRILNPILNGEEVAISLLRTYPIVIYSPKCYSLIPYKNNDGYGGPGTLNKDFQNPQIVIDQI